MHVQQKQVHLWPVAQPWSCAVLSALSVSELHLWGLIRPQFVMASLLQAQLQFTA